MDKEMLPIVLDINIRQDDPREEYDYNSRYAIGSPVVRSITDGLPLDKQDVHELKPNLLLDFSYHKWDKITVESFSDQAITILYKKETITIRLGQEWHTRFDNGFSLSEVTLRYHRLDFWETVSMLMNRILKVHEHSLHPIITSTTAAEQQVINLLNAAIDDGKVGLYPFKARLHASNNWYTGKILRLGMFQDILLEGIGRGALSPDNAEGWEWLKVAADNNDPAEFMTDMERYYDLLASAAEAGNTDALDIMNEIWPPEQIIEED